MAVQYATFFEVSVPVFTAPPSLLPVFRCNCFCKVQTRRCSFFLSFLKAIVCFWADDFVFLGRLPAGGVTTIVPAPNPRAAGGCRRGHPLFTTWFSLKKISKAAVVFEIRQLQIQNISTHSITYEWQPVNYLVLQITVYKCVLILQCKGNEYISQCGQSKQVQGKYISTTRESVVRISAAAA